MTLNMVSIGSSGIFDSLANLAYLVRDRIDPLCLDREVAEALESAEVIVLTEQKQISSSTM